VHLDSATVWAVSGICLHEDARDPWGVHWGRPLCLVTATATSTCRDFSSSGWLSLRMQSLPCQSRSGSQWCKATAVLYSYGAVLQKVLSQSLTHCSFYWHSSQKVTTSATGVRAVNGCSPSLASSKVGLAALNSTRRAINSALSP
jgi:hypothetical protein